MKKVYVAALALAAVMLCIVSANSQPPGDKKGPGKKGPPGGPGGPPPGFQLGKVLPPHIREDLDLSEEQEKQLEALEKEVKNRLMKILSVKQQKQIEKLRNRRPGPPGDGPGGDRDGDKGDRKKGKGDRERDSASTLAPAKGIQWFSTWESGVQEARRTGKPILLVSAAPHCAGVPGIW
jgi:hypothetical protein